MVAYSDFRVGWGMFLNSTAKCGTLQYQAANAISLKTIAGCLKSKHFFGR
jgi:hypothetical protein